MPFRRRVRLVGEPPPTPSPAIVAVDGLGPVLRGVNESEYVQVASTPSWLADDGDAPGSTMGHVVPVAPRLYATPL